MWKSLAATTILLCLSAPPAFAAWIKASPGAGGSFQTVDVAADGKVLVGSDLSGARGELETGTRVSDCLGRHKEGSVPDR